MNEKRTPLFTLVIFVFTLCSLSAFSQSSNPISGPYVCDLNHLAWNSNPKTALDDMVTVYNNNTPPFNSRMSSANTAQSDLNSNKSQFVSAIGSLQSAMESVVSNQLGMTVAQLLQSHNSPYLSMWNDLNNRKSTFESAHGILSGYMTTYRESLYDVGTALASEVSAMDSSRNTLVYTQYDLGKTVYEVDVSYRASVSSAKTVSDAAYNTCNTAKQNYETYHDNNWVSAYNALLVVDYIYQDVDAWVNLDNTAAATALGSVQTSRGSMLTNINTFNNYTNAARGNLDAISSSTVEAELYNYYSTSSNP